MRGSVDLYSYRIISRSPRMRSLPYILGAVLLVPAVGFGQQASSAGQPDPNDPTVRLRLPVLTVTAEKVPQDPQRVPVSVTAVPKATLDSSVPRGVSDAADLAPN